jgi:hypothetical protein
MPMTSHSVAHFNQHQPFARAQRDAAYDAHATLAKTFAAGDLAGSARRCPASKADDEGQGQKRLQISTRRCRGSAFCRLRRHRNNQQGEAGEQAQHV